jgi:two-component system KDP operon response regulator KdpE
MTETCVLVVEDDPNIVDLVRSNLMARGYFVVVDPTGGSVSEMIDEFDPAIVLLDLMLPGGDGFDICREVRQRSDIGLIVVSARTSEPDKVRALNMGADDYLTKPFGIDELLARMVATLRRSRLQEDDPIDTTVQLGDLTVDLEAKLVTRAGERIALTPTEYALLRYFVVNPGVLLSYEQILRDVWGRGYENSREYVRVYVGRLRSKLEGVGVEPMFLTEPRAGYRFLVPGTSEAAEAEVAEAAESGKADTAD